MKTVRITVLCLLVCALLMGSVSLAENAAASPTAADLKIDGTVVGTVVDVDDQDIVINMANGNTVMFLLTFLGKTEAAVGDTVTVEYSGNVIDSPEAVSVTVSREAVDGLSISGTVIQFDAARIFILISSNNVYGFARNKSTTITGLSTRIEEGDEALITYSGDLHDAPLAKDIHITHVSRSGKNANKSLDGAVTALTDTLVTVNTNSGNTYSFQIDNSTRVSGSYDFAKGCRIRVTYDGFASETPLAKSVRVLSSKSANTPRPTNTPKPGHKTRSASGTVSYFNGIYLTLTNGSEFDTTEAAFGGNGTGEYGEKAAVTYFISENGVSYATKVVFTSTAPTPVPGPILRTASGTVATFDGNYLTFTNGSDFDTSDAAFSGSGSGDPGDSAKVTYYIAENGVSYATKVVFTANAPTPVPGPVIRTASGTVSSFNGSYLTLTNGNDFDTSEAAFSGSGSGDPGDAAKITYYVAENGVSYATKVVFTAPEPTYAPAPEPEPEPDPEPEVIYEGDSESASDGELAG